MEFFLICAVYSGTGIVILTSHTKSNWRKSYQITRPSPNAGKSACFCRAGAAVVSSITSFYLFCMIFTMLQSVVKYSCKLSDAWVRYDKLAQPIHKYRSHLSFDEKLMLETCSTPSSHWPGTFQWENHYLLRANIATRSLQTVYTKVMTLLMMAKCSQCLTMTTMGKQSISCIAGYRFTIHFFQSA